MILVTGANGYVGSRLVRALGADAIQWCRSDGDLTDAAPFAAFTEKHTLDSIDTIVHCAAVTRFNVEESLAKSVNVQGTRKAIDFARKCPNLHRFIFVSSLYSSGLKSGVIEEAPLDNKASFANFYESSKWQCEQDVQTSGVPWSIARVATVIADDASGEVTQFNAVHNTLKLFYHGLLSVLPGDRETPLYFTTGEFVDRSLIDIIRYGEAGTIYNVCHDQTACVRLGEFVDVTHSSFERDASFKRRAVRKPIFCDIDAFLLMTKTTAKLGNGIMSQASGSIAPFARQLAVSKNVRTDNLRALLHAPNQASTPVRSHFLSGSSIGTMTFPDQADLLSKVCDSLVRTKWGREL